MNPPGRAGHTSDFVSLRDTSAEIMDLGAALLAVAALQSPVVAATYQHESAPEVLAVRTSDTIRIDGRLDEPDWERAAPAARFTQLDPDEGQPASETTEVRVLIDGSALYIGATLFDSDPRAIVSRLARRDNATSDADWFQVYIDAYHDHLTAFEFGVTPAGSIRDASIGADGRADLSWDPVWAVKTGIDSRGWVAEIRIPLSQLRYSEQEDAVWGIQFIRKILRKQEVDLFAFTPKSENAGGNRYGHMHGVGRLRAPRRLELLPHSLVRAEYTTVPTGNPFRDGRDYFGDAGLELKYGLTSALTLGATVNPDFGQVEVDPAVINLTAFETKFDEQRPFFVEGAEQFRFGRNRASGSSDFPQLFFSRRIGAPPTRSLSGSTYRYADQSNQTAILGAAKVSGKPSGWSVGVLDAVTAEEQARYLDVGGDRRLAPIEPLTNFYATRLARELNAGNTTIGALVTAVHRDLSEPALTPLLRSDAYVAGADFNHSWQNRTWAVDGAIAGSSIHGSPAAITAAQRSSARYFQRPDASHLQLDSTRTGLLGHAGQFGLTKLAGVHWRGSIGYQEVSPGFEANDLGFQRHADFRNLAATIDYRENKPRRAVRNWRLLAFKRWGWDFGGTSLTDKTGLFGQVQFSNYWTVYGEVDRDFESFDARLTRGGPLAISPSGWSHTLTVTSDDRKPFQATGSTSYFTDSSGGWTSSSYLSTSIKPSPQVRVSIGPAFTRAQASAQFTTRVSDALATMTYGQRYVFAALDETSLALPTRLDWTFTPQLSLQLFAQPFIASARYYDYAEFYAPRTFRFDVYGQDRGTIARDSRGIYTIDPDGPAGGAQSFTLADPSFDLHTLRSSIVLRWEYRPGSTLFFALQRRSEQNNVFVIKATYWIGL